MKIGDAAITTNNRTTIIIIIASLAIGITVGAIFIANLIDANGLRQYQASPKITKFATLNDDAAGNKAGWDPDVPNHRGPETHFFTIKDNTVNQNSIVYTSVLGKQ